jgi:serine/threonine protein kinase
MRTMPARLGTGEEAGPPTPDAAGALSNDFLKRPSQGVTAGETVLGRPLTEKAGDRIGRYKLLEQIGEGGFGVVYMAEQKEPIKRRVALKIIKLGMDTKQVVARFEAERQALAMMDHPNIAKVHDAGATETGRPYFVMELVRGTKIMDYCNDHQLSTRKRLELFVQVCQAIQHAHQKGIIHRDIKPSNILVTPHDGVPVPKVIDFGIAKATAGQELTDKTLFTQFHYIEVGPYTTALAGAVMFNQIARPAMKPTVAVSLVGTLYAVAMPPPPRSRRWNPEWLLVTCSSRSQ